MGTLVIIGAGGHGKVAADIAGFTYDRILFLDDGKTGDCAGCPIVGKTENYKDNLRKADFFVAVGNAGIRRRILGMLEEDGAEIVSLIHPDAVIARSAVLGNGSIVMAGAVINPEAVIGKGCIINTCASVDHDCVLSDGVHVSVGAHIAGTVAVGKDTWVGAGAIVSNNLSVCSDCMIGAGAVVVSDIRESGTYVGVPARRMVK